MGSSKAPDWRLWRADLASDLEHWPGPAEVSPEQRLSFAAVFDATTPVAAATKVNDANRLTFMVVNCCGVLCVLMSLFRLKKLTAMLQQLLI